MPVLRKAQTSLALSSVYREGSRPLDISNVRTAATFETDYSIECDYGAARVDGVAAKSAAIERWNTRASPTPTNDGEELQALLTNASAKGAAEQRMIGAIEAQFDIHAMDPEDFAEMWVEISATLDELIASVLAALNQGGCDQCGKRNGHHPACIYKKGP
jgi:hypothetical protein